MVGLHVLPPAVLAVLAIGNQAGHSKRRFAALKGVEQSRVPIKQYLQKFPQWGRFGVTSVTPFLLLPVHPEGCTPARRT